ncbi:hypothetical protein [Colwellia psychrerythraea]|uniref:J domain-containing protein n=1 Tax=Colwellia psychrerythraea TaxID=28229 RepID=A0A099K8P8_COLPS|nr:hypothetical protein [Colwellia psychrerythraea]KGJ86467.1 hypothetical protein GAB14E_0740 [Colwellia psychrerythraea]
MSNQFNSIDMIKNEFNISEESIDTVRGILRNMQSSLHPDKNGGEFKSVSEESNYHKLDSAINFIDSQKTSNSDLIAMSAVTDLTKAVTNLISSQNQGVNTSIALSTALQRNSDGYKARMKMPKIALTAVTAALSGLWLFPNTVKDHPVLSNYVNFNDSLTNFIWMYLVISSVAFWIYTWRKEESIKENNERLKTETEQNRIFKGFIKKIEFKNFSLEDFVEHIKDKNLRKVDITLAHAIAEVILERAIKRKVILTNDSGVISTVYSVLAANKPIKQD